MAYTLNKKDTDRIYAIQYNLFPINLPRTDYSFLKVLIPDLSVFNLTENYSILLENPWASGENLSVLDFENAKYVIKTLQNFYRNYDWLDVGILKIHPHLVTYEDNELIRRFLERNKDSTSEYSSEINTKAEVIELLDSKFKNPEIASIVIDWIIDNEKDPELIRNLSKLTRENLNKINTFSGIATLRNCLQKWTENIDNPTEDFWQNEFKENSSVISQLFTSTLVIIKSKAYIGGKNIENEGGLVADFIFANKLSKNTSIIELKTPSSRILSSKYRETIYNVSSELTGAIIQLCNYKDEFTKNYYTLSRSQSEATRSYDPSCILIIGNFQKECTSEEKIKSFELYRQQLNNIQVITFDELFEKMKLLISLLEKGH
ncbi:Shedu immune nuclease family protein [Leptospira santarosai]|uniref:PF14082 domain protein n=1 Tax=Leptospira santarosai str. MOR084 TaxID=1049984 RepID=A0A0E2BFV9_9LEPT|nr:Shedu immune nuclease family protein [Leptospira santarosai]EKO34190.1 PF14082 domain protein [Leptospira santarosai str. MOR084]